MNDARTTLPVVALVGRPNVGKSTLFNRIIKRRDAIVDPTPGVTRDAKSAAAEWAGRHFTLVDTGGFITKSDNEIDRAVRTLLDTAIADADLILFLADGRSGITGQDEDIAGVLRRSQKPVILVVNKIDDEVHEGHTAEFYELGFDLIVSISALGGRKIGDFLDLLITHLPSLALSADETEVNEIRLAVVGRPNVGKSSYINAVLGTPKLIVTDIPGTTRDAIDSRFLYKDQAFVLVDTAGLRRKSRIIESVEYYSTQRALRAISSSHAVVLMIDAIDGLNDQDSKILEQIIKNKKGIVLAVNKWDAVEKNAKTAQIFEKQLRTELKSIDYLPILFISALKKVRIFKVLDIALSVHNEWRKTVRTRELNTFIEKVTRQHVPPSFRGREVKIKFCSQVKSAPPVFAFFCNTPGGVGINYRHFLENQLRHHFGFFGVPLTLSFRKK